MLKRIRELLGRRVKNGSTAAAAPTDPSTSIATVDPVEPVRVPEPVVHQGPRAVHMPIPEEDLDPEAVKIVRRLARFDHIAYLVGGCVRDLLLDRKPKDFDIATSATPRQVKRAFRNCRIVGRRFRLAHVYFQDGKIIEVATFRAREVDDDDEGAREDDDLMIRDDNVFGTPEEDALRRDFTINQLFYDLGSGIVLDHAGGLDDLKRAVVRTIGDPEIRFREDPIRILRAIKFAARLDFSIEPGTRRAIDRTRGEIPRAAPPRVLEELNRFCRGGAAARSFEWMRSTGVFEVVIPEYADAFVPDGPRWDLLHAFLERFDRRVAENDEPRTGEMFAALVLPQLIDALGWDAEQGRVERSRGFDVRKLADDALRPVALRLRVSRKDQEHARQVLMALVRMIPADRLRPAARRAIHGRPSFPAALDMLGVLARRFGGTFEESLASWTAEESDATPRRPARTRGESAAEGPTDAAADEGRPRRRRRRRRGRGGGARDEVRESAPAAPAVHPAAARDGSGASGRRRTPDPNLPPVWDERYFFAALPTVPKEIDEPAGSAGDAPEPGAVAERPEAAEAPSRPRRRRRRGGRGRGRGGAGGTAEAAPGGSDDGNGPGDA